MNKRILVTGAAGFIGFHVAQKLSERGDFVVGCDNFNSYYSPELKKKRAELLRAKGVEIFSGDICDLPFLQETVRGQQITHILHLAAQAGVRYSLKNPHAYVDANLSGFVNILEVCREFAGIKLIYASSSSVYGLNTKVPFSEKDQTDRPASFYGATKKANELMAHSYHHLFQIPVTGLRFFTVYGPWGRPDMAYYSFTDAIERGLPIQVYHFGKMQRDFTYIDDVVSGTIAAVDLGAACETFNLGNHQPVELMHFIHVLEQSLGKKAVLEYLPLQPGDVLATYADIDHSSEKLGFSPKTTIEEGIPKFVEWYRRNATC